MTKQEYYDLLVKTSVEGGFPSKAGEGARIRCMYRSPEGKKCAVGIIIPDEVYEPHFDDPSLRTDTVQAGTNIVHIWHLIKDHSWVPEGMSRDDLFMVQKAHDMVAFACTRHDIEPDWDHGFFLKDLNKLPCFSWIAKVPSPVETAAWK